MQPAVQRHFVFKRGSAELPRHLSGIFRFSGTHPGHRAPPLLQQAAQKRLPRPQDRLQQGQDGDRAGQVHLLREARERRRQVQAAGQQAAGEEDDVQREAGALQSRQQGVQARAAEQGAAEEEGQPEHQQPQPLAQVQALP